MNAEITLICEVCNVPVARGKGSVYIRTGDVVDYRLAEKEWGEAHPGGEAVELHQFLKGPEEIHWRTAHDACRTDHDEPCYEIGDDQIATWGALASWTAHLMSKNWLELSDWDDLLREVSGEIPAVRIRLVAREAA